MHIKDNVSCHTTATFLLVEREERIIMYLCSLFSCPVHRRGGRHVTMHCITRITNGKKLVKLLDVHAAKKV